MNVVRPMAKPPRRQRTASLVLSVLWGTIAVLLIATYRIGYSVVEININGRLEPSSTSKGLSHSTTTTSDSRLEHGKLSDSDYKNLEKTSLDPSARLFYGHQSSSRALPRTSSYMLRYKHQYQDFVFANLLIHIPKAGGLYALIKLRQMSGEQGDNTSNHPAFLQDLENWKNQVSSGAPFVPCNAGGAQWSDFDRGRFEKITRDKGRWCTLWSSEGPYDPSADYLPLYLYSIVRDPKAHVLSQYFHCTESEDHADRHGHMPSLTEWLQAWANALDSPELQQQHFKQFACYNPINMQSAMLGYAGSTFDRPVARLLTSQRLAFRSELQQRYVVLGDLGQMELSLCAIFIEWTNFVPRSCDCTATDVSEHHPNYVPVEKAHGVKNHGNTFATTPAQDALILKLTQVDTVLYQEAQTLLLEKVEELQARFQIRLCHQQQGNR